MTTYFRYLVLHQSRGWLTFRCRLIQVLLETATSCTCTYQELFLRLAVQTSVYVSGAILGLGQGRPPVFSYPTPSFATDTGSDVLNASCP